MRRRPLLHVPAIKALLIQLISLPITLGLVHGAAALTQVQLTLVLAALSQGAISASLSRLCGLAPWWSAIQAAFPITLVATLSLQLPPTIFLAAFVALLGLYWSTFRTQVPFYPSRPAVWEAVASVLPKDRSIQFVDIGSGFGGLVMHLAKMREESVFMGVEIAPLPWLASRLRSCLMRARARFIMGDYDSFDLASYDVVFAYLSPAAMPSLWRKAGAEMRKGTLLLSYEFDIPGATPHLTVIPADHGPVLYGWYM